MTRNLGSNSRHAARSAGPLSFAKTPHEAIFIHVTCYTTSLYVIDFICAPNFGEAQVSMGRRNTRPRSACRGLNS